MYISNLIGDYRFSFAKDFYYASSDPCLSRSEDATKTKNTANEMSYNYSNTDLYQFLNFAFLIQQKTHNNKPAVVSQPFYHLFFAVAHKSL